MAMDTNYQQGRREVCSVLVVVMFLVCVKVRGQSVSAFFQRRWCRLLSFLRPGRRENHFPVIMFT